MNGCTVFIDTNVAVYARDPGHLGDGARAILHASATGAIRARTSAAVIEELWHLELRDRPRGMTGAARALADLLAPVIDITHELLVRAFRLDLPKELGANDRLHLAACHTWGIDVIISADAAFGRAPLIERVDPLDPDAVERLLGC